MTCLFANPSASWAAVARPHEEKTYRNDQGDFCCFESGVQVERHLLLC
jgi:hypothetical protein